MSLLGKIRQPVILIGSHRSGTSATARALRDLGLFTGVTEFSDYHAEAYLFIDIHNDYLKSNGAAWYQPRPFLETLKTPEGRAECTRFCLHHTHGRFGYGPLKYQGLARRFAAESPLELMNGKLIWGWKDPRTTLFISSWLEVFPEAKVLHIVRHPLDCAISLHKRELRWQAEENPLATGVLGDLETALDVVSDYVAAGVAVADHPGYREVRFEDLQANPREVLEDLAGFSGLSPSAADLNQTAGTIENERQARWRELPVEQAVSLMARYPFASRFGYEIAVAA